MTSKIVHAVDSWLWTHGFRIEKIRVSLRVLFLLNVLFLFFGILTLFFSSVFFFFAIASIIASFNYYDIAYYVMQNFPTGGAKQISIGQTLRWVMRLGVTIFLLALCLILFNANPISLILGISVPVVILTVIFLLK